MKSTGPETPRILSREECKAIFHRCVALAKPDADLRVRIGSRWTAGAQWARNRIFFTRDLHETWVEIIKNRRWQMGAVTTDRLDENGLREAVDQVERAFEYSVSGVGYDTRVDNTTPGPILHPKLWSDATALFDGERRGDAVRQMIAPVETAGYRAGGELRVQAGASAVFSTNGVEQYYPTTRVDVSTTVRDAKSTGSGWAGTDDFDIARIDLQALGQRAFEKCRMSVNPVALEPGRYTTILEPQAVADLWSPVMSRFQFPTEMTWDRGGAEGDDAGVAFAKGNSQSKIGERVLDPRLTVSADPMDPEGGFLPFDTFDGEPYQRVDWIEQGVLRQLAYGKGYGLGFLGIENQILNPKSWRMSGGTTSTDEMIATTKRGLLVTRFHNVDVFHLKSLSCTGFTRDGVWLIENGKITKPVKNFRFTESPLFVFNNVEQVGEAKRVYSEAGPLKGYDFAWIAPTLKVRDFNFSQLADAV